MRKIAIISGGICKGVNMFAACLNPQGTVCLVAQETTSNGWGEGPPSASPTDAADEAARFGCRVWVAVRTQPKTDQSRHGVTQPIN